MIKNIVFDMGNVLIMFYPEKTLRKYLTDEDDINLVLEKFYSSGVYRDCDRGVKTYKQVIDSLRDELPPRLIKLLERLYLEQSFGKVEMPVFPEMESLVAKLKEKGYKTYLLSNAGFDFYDYSKNIPAIAFMDGVVVSCDYKVLKPEAEIYNILFKKFNLNPRECIFIDDVPENIEGARLCGMDGIVFSPSFQPVPELIKKLKNKGIKID